MGRGAVRRGAAVPQISIPLLRRSSAPNRVWRGDGGDGVCSGVSLSSQGRRRATWEGFEGRGHGVWRFLIPALRDDDRTVQWPRRGIGVASNSWNHCPTIQQGHPSVWSCLKGPPGGRPHWKTVLDIQQGVSLSSQGRRRATWEGFEGRGHGVWRFLIPALRDDDRTVQWPRRGIGVASNSWNHCPTIQKGHPSVWSCLKGPPGGAHTGKQCSISNRANTWSEQHDSQAG